MNKKFAALALAFCLALALGAPVIAAELSAEEETSAASMPEVIDPNSPRIVVNDQVLNLEVPARLIYEQTYVPYMSIVKALYPDATAQWNGERTVVTATGLTLEIPVKQPYFIANGRYLYLPQGNTILDNHTLLPVRTLCAALGANVAWDPVGFSVVITAGENGPIASASEAYGYEDLYWLSHIINAESGNQPLEGKIAVGNVVLNRVASSIFPNSIYDVIFQKHQFTPTANGSIRLEPNAESIITAKLCLDGANTVGNALFFLNPRTAPNSWASRNRPYLTTIGAHAFYG